MAEEKQEKVKDSDILRVLAKHASTPNDPDDADTLTRWNEQQAETAAEEEDKPKTQTQPQRRQ